MHVEDGLDAEAPLEGVKVLDLTRALSGPFCTTLLGDLGADVLKVESLDGDMIRKWGPFHGGESVYHLSVNRGKRSLSLDFRSDEGKRILHELVSRTDVLVENFRPGVMAKLGLEPYELLDGNKRLVYASLTGFGSVGPLKDDPAFDQIAQGMGGLMSVTGLPGTEPTRVGIPISDLLSGVILALGVSAGLARQASTGRGGLVETSLIESVVGVMTFQAQRYLSLRDVPDMAGNDHPIMSPYGVFKSADKSFNLAVGTERQWGDLCRVIGREDLLGDKRFVDGEGRRLNRAVLRRELESTFGLSASSDLLTQFRSAGIPCGPINGLDAVFREEQVVALDMVQEIGHRTLGTLPTVRGPLRIDGNVGAISRPAPMLGEHSEQVLFRELGSEVVEVERLIQSGIVRQWNHTTGGG